MVTRVPVFDVRPQIEGGRHAVKVVEHEEITVRAQVFGEDHLVVRAAVVLTAPDGQDRPAVPLRPVGDDLWAATVVPDLTGTWTYRIISWHDPLAAWVRDARVKIEAGVDVDLTLAEGSAVLLRAQHADPAAASVADALGDPDVEPIDRLATALAFISTLPRDTVRDHLDTTAAYPLVVDRERALVGSWYTLFPRSEGATVDADGTVRPGTLRTAAKRLEQVAAMGFDVVHLPPVHPIGRTGRRGRDGALVAAPGDPGSPWAVGAVEGGHDTVHPELGTFDDFDAFVERAHQLGIEVALDLALQCSPDHPWVQEHPEWFRAGSAGPHAPQQEVSPLDFDTDPVGLYVEVLHVLSTWIDHGVRIFRVHSPQGKPVAFWQQLLADVRTIDPDVVFVSDTTSGPTAGPAMTRALATVGFHQSTTSLMVHEGASETSAHLDEVSNRTSDVLRPAFFVNTPDVLPRNLQGAEPSMFAMRAALAATGSPTWGIAAGYELCENETAGAHQGVVADGYRHPEAYAVPVRDWDSEESIAPYIARLNEIRRRHVALQRLRNLVTHSVDHMGVIAYSKVSGDDLVLVVIDLFPAFRKRVGVDVTAEDLGLPAGTTLRMRDEIDGTECDVSSVPLDVDSPARILVLAHG